MPRLARSLASLPGLLLACTPPVPATDTDPASTTAATTTGTTALPTTDGPDTDAPGSTTGSTTPVATTTTDATTDATTDTTDATTGDPPASGAFDLDADGTPETDLSLGPCTLSPDGTCLLVSSPLVALTELPLAATIDQCDGNYQARRLELLGDHSGDGLAELAARFCRFDGAEGPPALAVVDLAAASIVARADAPVAQDYAWSDSVRDPEGLRHPFLAPSYGDGENVNGNWGYLCVWRPELPAAGNCGPGFSAIPTLLAPGEFREVGGTLQDLDGDGWDDINLIYHRRQYSVSPATLGLLQTIEYDVAAADEPNSPKWFHSGRNYGTHAAVTGGDGKPRLVVVGGTPLGSFSDDLCNVSRFLAVLEQSPGQPGTRALAWSRYFGFSSTIFATYDAKYVADPMQDVARLADAVDGCIHRFSDSRTSMDGAEVLLINYFAMAAPIDLCLVEQFALYQPPTWTDEKADAWYSCFAKNRTAPGVWGMQVVDERTGLGLTGSQGTYVWGWSDLLLPGERVYLVEYLAGPGAFDLSDRPLTPLKVHALSQGLWQARGEFPIAGRPKLQMVDPAGPRGVGSYTLYSELTLHPGDPAGVELADGSIVAHDQNTDTWILR
ncbi:MAG: hypothetical protein IPO88_32130 [Nannocystis sp.]|uniref:hypothetical protein n=1 Tax=Nannocystis sp. TaxID=1962667 RepID=UPI002423E3C9|nr:hypothetical protein [Nannocystis sp.]MBK9758083.1 hypothetical protein [Nannocystis sp.]